MAVSQSIKPPREPGAGLRPAKKIVRRKRHIAIDSDGRLLLVKSRADISDSAGAQPILDGIRKRWPWVRHLLADRRLGLMDKASCLDFVMEIFRERGRRRNAASGMSKARLRRRDKSAATGSRWLLREVRPSSAVEGKGGRW